MESPVFSHPVGNSFTRLFDQSLVHSQHPVSLGGLQRSLHLLPPHLHLDMQALKQLKTKLNHLILDVTPRIEHFLSDTRFLLTSNQVYNKFRG